MKLEDFIRILRESLSSESIVLTDQQNPDFTASSERWSDLGLKTPGAIIKPINEEDVVRTVCPILLLAYFLQIDILSTLGQRSIQNINTIRSRNRRPQYLVYHWRKWLHSRSQSLQRRCCRAVQKFGHYQRGPVDERASNCPKQRRSIHQCQQWLNRRMYPILRQWRSLPTIL